MPSTNMCRFLASGIAIGSMLVLSAPPVSAAQSATAACSGTAYGPPKGWGPVSKGCAVFGNKDTLIYYSWFVNSSNEGKACVEGWGYPKLIGPVAPGQDLRGPGRWFSLGCGTRGGASVHGRGVEWGSNLGPTKVRAKSLNIPLPVTIKWSH